MFVNKKSLPSSVEATSNLDVVALQCSVVAKWPHLHSTSQANNLKLETWIKILILSIELCRAICTSKNCKFGGAQTLLFHWLFYVSRLDFLEKKSPQRIRNLPPRCHFFQTSGTFYSAEIHQVLVFQVWTWRWLSHQLLWSLLEFLPALPLCVWRWCNHLECGVWNGRHEARKLLVSHQPHLPLLYKQLQALRKPGVFIIKHHLSQFSKLTRKLADRFDIILCLRFWVNKPSKVQLIERSSNLKGDDPDISIDTKVNRKVRVADPKSQWSASLDRNTSQFPSETWKALILTSAVTWHSTKLCSKSVVRFLDWFAFDAVMTFFDPFFEFDNHWINANSYHYDLDLPRFFLPQQKLDKGEEPLYFPKASRPLDITRHSALDNQKYQLICPSVQIMKRLKNRPLVMRPNHGGNCDDFLSHGKNHSLWTFQDLKVQLLGQKWRNALKWVVYPVYPTFPTFSQGFLHLRRLSRISFIKFGPYGPYNQIQGQHFRIRSCFQCEWIVSCHGGKNHPWKNPRRRKWYPFLQPLSRRPWEIMTKTDIWGSLVEHHERSVIEAFIWAFPKIVGFPPKSSIWIGVSIMNHPFWGTPIFWKHPYLNSFSKWLGFPATAACAPCIWHFSASFCGRCLYRLREISESRDETLPVPSNGHNIPIAEIQAFAVSCAASTRRVRHVLQPWDQRISKKYSTYPEMESKLFRTTLTFRMAYADAKEKVPEINHTFHSGISIK